MVEGKIPKISLGYYNLGFSKIISVERVNNEACSLAFSVFPSPVHSVRAVVICWNSLLCDSSVPFVPSGDTGSRPLSEHTARLRSLR